MKVRCGSCRTEFDVPGAGRFACPVCSSVNVVRAAADQGQPPPQQQPPQQPPPQQQRPAQQQGMGGYRTAPGVVPGAGSPPPPPPPDEPLPKIECPECDFTFVVGKIATATCPNCSAEVPTGIEEENTE